MRIMKSILFVINTMGMGGAENALLELLQQIDYEKYDVSLFVLTGQGELIDQIPEQVHLLNKKFFPIPVLDKAGEIRLFKTVIRALFVRGTVFRRTGYIVSNLADMIKTKNVQKDKLLWKILSDSAQRLNWEFDLAIAYLEGGSAYYTASYVKAKKKAAFVHTNYEFAGYNRKLDEDCYLNFDRIFTVSKSVREAFLSVYPECKENTEVFYNLINKESILWKAREKGGFTDDYQGLRILTVGRLIPLKAIDVAIEAMHILKESGIPFRWYVLGEGSLRKKLEEKIRHYGLMEDFFLLGTVDNPFPYYAQCDIYVHTAYCEGKSVAIEEAQILGCAILASDHSGVREQVRDGKDGKICELKSDVLAENILDFAKHQDKWRNYGYAASTREQADKQKEMDKLMNLADTDRMR